MKIEQWLAAFAVVVACGKSAESKQDPKPDPKQPKAAGGGSLAGFYRVDAVTLDSKKIDLAEAFKASLKSDGKLELDLMRMTVEVDGAKLTVSVDQVLGSPGSATYCSVHATTEVDIADGKLTMPTIEAVAAAGVVSAKDGDTSKDTTKCNVAMTKGVYTITGSGAKVDLSTTTPDGKQATMHLVSDDKSIDLKARATAFAKR